MTEQVQTTGMIIGAEVWSPVDGSMLRQAAVPSIGDLDRRISIGDGHPTDELIESVVGSRMPRIIEGSDINLVTLLWPVIDRSQVSAVVALYLDTTDSSPLATELWSGRAGRSELCLSESSYISLDRFAKLSPFIAFPKGSGLPGRVWDSNLPEIDENLSSSSTFMRSTGAETEGLDVGFAMPCIDGTSLQAVALLLSGRTRSVARVYETWSPSQKAGSLRLRCADGVYVDTPAIKKASHDLDIPAGDTWIGRAWATRKPEVVHDSSGSSLKRHGAESDQLTSGIAIPIIVLEDVAAVAVLMW